MSGVSLNPNKDWREPVCAKLAELADEAKVPYFDSAWVMRKLYEMAAQERLLSPEQRLGALKAVEKYSQRGLTQMMTIVKKLRKVPCLELPTQTDAAVAANVESGSSPKKRISANVEKVEKIIPLIKWMPIFSSSPIECAYGLLLDKDYPCSGVASSLDSYIRASFLAPAIAAVTGCAKAGLRHDLLVSQNVSSYQVLKLLMGIDWVRSVIAKPVSLYGVSVISAD